MVKSWIINPVSREIFTSVMCLKTAKEVWKDINERFGQSNGSKYLQIYRDISTTMQGSSDIANYFTKLRTLWDELNLSNMGPTCSCWALPKFIEDQQLFQFLNGLNESYSIIKSIIMMMNPLSPISKVYSILQQDKSQREAPYTPSFSGDSASFLASPTSFNNNNRNFTQRVNFDSKRKANSVSCKYCKKTGHIVDKYYRLHGFSVDFKFTKNKKSTSCVQTEVPYASPSCSSAASSDNSTHGFTKKQYQHLMSMFQQVQLSTRMSPGVSSTEDSVFAHFAGLFSAYAADYHVSHARASSHLGIQLWILDSGAVNHMTPHKHLLQNLTPLPKPFFVTLPNGYKVKVISTRSLHLRHGIILINVLFVPSLQFNLISIHQLITQLDYIIVLTKTNYLLQGPYLKRPLVIGKAAWRLYYLHPDVDLFPSSLTASIVQPSSISCNKPSSFTSSSINLQLLLILLVIKHLLLIK
ncbi:uncharacterized protein LOC142178603 [Nicotiana tabacum]|uniref:Uncharacterized protein LOC142178603 n=1 Tax=Nicotiana tabacum TaxID=4097 RepID=A0AC58U503_TOBAC